MPVQNIGLLAARIHCLCFSLHTN